MKGQEALLLELGPGGLDQLGQALGQVQLHGGAPVHIVEHVLGVLGPDLGALEGVVHPAVVVHQPGVDLVRVQNVLFNLQMKG